MMRSQIRSHFEPLLENSFLLVILAFFLIRAEHWHLTIIALGTGLFLAADHAHTPSAAAAAGVILLLFLIPLYQSDAALSGGRVIDVRSSYAIVQKGRKRILIYTASLPEFDSVIEFDGTAEPIETTPGFFRFPFARYMHLKGIDASVRPDTITVIKPAATLRGRLMHRLKTYEDPYIGSLLLEVLFHIRSEAEPFSGFFNDRGFSLAGILGLTDWILNYTCYESKRERWKLIVITALSIFYHVPYILLVRLLRMCLKHTSLNAQAQRSIAVLTALRVYPEAVFSPSFLLPFLHSLPGERRKDAAVGFLFSLHGASLIFHSVNPLELLLFPSLLIISGFCWVMGMLEALLHIPLHPIILFADRITSLLSVTALPGTLLGAGLPFYVILFFSIPRSKYQNSIRIALFLFFQACGLFHPLAELTFLNVGQGDSILIRAPFSTADILIDTGKPSQKNNVFRFLQAKGIRRLNTLLITHSDNDHSGNMEAVIETYDPKQIITEHQTQIQAMFLRFLDLNDLKNDDENESSIVCFGKLNGMKILLMGDSSVRTEERIVMRFPELRADILKLSHHGSKTGSSELFLNTVRPGLAIVSSGAYRIYHHPSPEVIERLNERRIPYLDTKEDGDISVLCFPGFNLLLTASGKIAIIRV